MAPVALLVATVVVVVAGHRRLRASVVVLAAVVLGLATRVLEVHASVPLAAPVAFLLAAVPMAVLLARIGFLDEVAARLPRGPRLAPALWGVPRVWA